ncbi:MAG: thioredoxin family protein [Acidimicrobiia bacterium]|nr:thioredoxin family protein [Acidimicrobiia bacterium]MDQ3499935.1 thioredoxin family protein [Actinomycetota bacterium]
MLRRFVPLFLLAVAALACSQGPAPLAVVANAPGTFDVGEPQRLMVALIEADTSEYLASPNLAAEALLVAPDGQELSMEADFVWTVPDVVGIYLIHTTFDQVGTWWVKLKASGLSESTQYSFIVSEDADPMPGIGDPAISVETRTTADHKLEDISTDSDPEPAFYTTSLDEALGSGRPTVIVFATPAFCESQTCGPMLDQVKAVAEDHARANFIHVEIYENAHTATEQDLLIDPAVDAWGLPSEPWVFVVDQNGIVTARFEGTLQEGELESALRSLDT